jgi:hypothetical protein
LKGLGVSSEPVKHICWVLSIIEELKEADNIWVLECSLHPGDCHVLVAALGVLLLDELIDGGLVDLLHLIVAFNARFDDGVNFSFVITFLDDLVHAIKHRIFVQAENTISALFLID